MLKTNYVVVGDNYCGIAAFRMLQKYGKRVTYINASNKDITIPDYITEKNFLLELLNKEPNLKLEHYKKAREKFKADYSFRVERMLEVYGVATMKGQPELLGEKRVGIHTTYDQQIIGYDKLYYVPSGRNFLNPEFEHNASIFGNIDDIFDDLGTKSKILVITDKIEDIEVVFGLSKLKLNLTLIVKDELYELLKIELTDTKIKFYKFRDIEKIGDTEIVIDGNTLAFDKLYYNYISIVDHNYYKLNQFSIDHGIILGDSLGQSYQNMLYELDEKLSKSPVELFYEECRYDVKLSRLNKTYLNYMNLTRSDEVIMSHEIKSPLVEGMVLCDRNQNVIGAELVGDNSMLEYFVTRIRKPNKIENIKEFISTNM
jgi:hypothetical protein